MNHQLEYIYNFFENTLPSLYKTKEIRLTQVQMAVAGMMSPRNI